MTIARPDGGGSERGGKGALTQGRSIITELEEILSEWIRMGYIEVTGQQPDGKLAYQITDEGRRFTQRMLQELELEPDLEITGVSDDGSFRYHFSRELLNSVQQILEDQGRNPLELHLFLAEAERLGLASWHQTPQDQTPKGLIIAPLDLEVLFGAMERWMRRQQNRP